MAQNLGEAMQNSIVSIHFHHVYSLRMSSDVVGLRTCLEACQMPVSGLPEVQHRQSRAMESNFDIFVEIEQIEADKSFLSFC